MPARHFTRRLKFAYLSAFALIVVFLLLAQLTIQLTLRQEIATRTIATSLNQQELRSQRLLRNTLFFLDPKMDHTIPLAELTKDYAAWVPAETTLEQIIPADQQGRLQAGKSEYLKMRGALQELIAHQSSKTQPKPSDLPQITTIFYSQQVYLSGLIATFNELSTDADSQVSRIQTLEALLFLLSLGTLGFEALAVIRPAIRDYNEALAKLEQAKSTPQVQKGAHDAIR